MRWMTKSDNSQGDDILAATLDKWYSPTILLAESGTSHMLLDSLHLDLLSQERASTGSPLLAN